MKKFISEEGLIVAFDFDNTLVENSYPQIGNPKSYAISTLSELKEKGVRIVIWTCREELKPVREWLNKWNIAVDAINSNEALTEKEWKKFGYHDSRKIAADIYVDDRNLFYKDDLKKVKEKILEIYNVRRKNERRKK